MGNTPVDIAGFCGHVEVVIEFCKELESTIKEDQGKSLNRSATPLIDEEAGRQNQIVPQLSGSMQGF